MFFLYVFTFEIITAGKFNNNGKIFDNRTVVMKDIISSLLTDGSLRVF